MTIPLKFLHLDDTSGQLKLKVGLYIFIILYTIFIEEHHLIGNLEEEASFYWQFGTGGPILILIWERMRNFSR